MYNFPWFFYLPWKILDLHSCVFFCAKIDDCNNFGAKVQIRQSIGRPEGIVPLCTSSPHPIWFIWPFGQFSVLTRFEHWPHVYQDMADQGGFIFKKKSWVTHVEHLTTLKKSDWPVTTLLWTCLLLLRAPKMIVTSVICVSVCPLRWSDGSNALPRTNDARLKW